jgi:hypothetical protein
MASPDSHALTAAGHTPTPAQSRREIDRLAGAFFRAVSFGPGEPARYDALPQLFVVGGRLINTSGSTPSIHELAAFVQSRLASHADGTLIRYEVQELADTTEVFGSVAHRASAFVRRGEGPGGAFETRGMIMLQMVRGPDGWRISAAAWDDQRAGQPLSTHPEPTEFGT